MKVTIDEAAKILECSRANVYQQLKKFGITTETETRDVEYTTSRKLKKQVFELDDLQAKRGVASPLAAAGRERAKGES